MARPKAFVEEQALDAAINVFREHGFEGTSAEMLVRALKIGRQSLYDTFGEKWQIYLASVRRYVGAETRAHVLALRSGPDAIVVVRFREAQAAGDVTPELDPKDAARFLSASFAGIGIAARGGAATKELRALGRLALRALQ